jgi:hypothetical protein
MLLINAPVRAWSDYWTAGQWHWARSGLAVQELGRLESWTDSENRDDSPARGLSKWEGRDYRIEGTAERMLSVVAGARFAALTPVLSWPLAA